MKKILLVVSFLVLGLGVARAGNHARHGMLLYGGETLFASHLVYKAPHNYQVILKVALSDEAQRFYEQASKDRPGQSLIWVLDPMDLKKIVEDKPELQGRLYAQDSQGERVDLDYRIEGIDYEILHFEELPLSLESHDH